MTSISRDPSEFKSTRWSLATLGEAEGDGNLQPLIELCRSHRYAAYALARCSGHPPARAIALVDDFLAGLSNAAVHGQSGVAGFRDFLHDGLVRFMARRGVDPAPDPADATRWLGLEGQLESQSLLGLPPREALMRAFGLQIIDRVRARLRAEAAASRRLDLFESLEPYLVSDPRPSEAAALESASGLGPLALQIAVRRLRQRFRELVDLELAETVSGAAQLQAERAALLDALVGIA